MKKYLFTVLILFAMLFVSVGTAAAATEIKFLGGIWAGGGVVFTFSSDDYLGGNGWLHARVTWNDGSANFTCNQEKKSNIITCSAPGTVADKNITVTFQGASYKTYVKSKEFCYSVWDYDTSHVWSVMASHCQDQPAQYGDIVNLTVNPYYPRDWNYTFRPDGGPCVGLTGDAYYFCNFPIP